MTTMPREWAIVSVYVPQEDVLVRTGNDDSHDLPCRSNGRETTICTQVTTIQMETSCQDSVVENCGKSVE